MRRLTIILVSLFIAAVAQAETTSPTAIETTSAIGVWLQHCTENANQAEPLATMMTMDCVFNSIKYCKTLPDDAAIDTCNNALTATFTKNAAQDMQKLKAYVPKSPMRKKGWTRKLDMLKMKTHPPCPETMSKTGCEATLAGLNWSLIHTYRREIDAAEK
jgi:hypothetical protein